jgi:hypothetical protein
VHIANLHALLELVGDGTLPRSCALSKGDRSTERPSCSAIAYAHDANIRGAGNRSVASHTSGHLDLHLELGVGCQRDTLHTEAGNVLCDCRRLHSSLIGSARCSVDIGLERTSAILIDLRLVSGE